MKLKNETGFAIHLKRIVCIKILLVFMALSAFSQGFVEGTVVDTEGSPIPGANVIIKGTTYGTITNIDGKFEISLPEGSTVLMVSFIGYLTEEVDVAGLSSVDITLVPDVTSFEEIVVIGYGTQKKSDLTGAITSVNAEDLQKSNSANMLQAMQGKAVGVSITPRTGMPGSETQIRVRGLTSLNESGNARWIVDGVPTDPRMINPSDIESVEILKDASVGAIYGSAAANGVVLVTTKKGVQGKPKVNLTMYRGWNNLPGRLDVLNAKEWNDMQNELSIVKLAKLGVADTTGLKLLPNSNLENYDYQELLFRTAATQNIDFSVSGGSERLTTYLGLNYNYNEAILKGMDYSRLGLRLNNEYKVNDKISVGANIAFLYELRNGIDEGPFVNEYNSPLTAAIGFAPTIKPYKDPSPTDLNRDSIWNTNDGPGRNPMLMIDLVNKLEKRYKADLVTYIIVSPFRGFKNETKVKLSGDYNNYRNVDRKYFYNASNQNDVYKMDKRYGNGQSVTIQDFATYKTNVGNAMNFEAMAGFESSLYASSSLGFGQMHLTTIDENLLYFGMPVTVPDSVETFSPSPKESASETRNYAYFGRINLDYKNIVFAQFNYRLDYSSKFGPDNRGGGFPGFSSGIKLSELDFVKNIEWLTFAKIRYGYGKAGNDNIPVNQFVSLVGEGTRFADAQYPMNNVSNSTGAIPVNLKNPKVRWETIETKNLGLDLKMFNNKLSVTVDRFQRNNIDMLYLPTTPMFAGWWAAPGFKFQETNGIDPVAYANVASLRSSGWEFVVGYKQVFGDLKVDVEANFMYVKNKVLDLNGDTLRYKASRPDGTIWKTDENGDLGYFVGLEYTGLFKPEDVDTLLRNTSPNPNRPRWVNVTKVTNQPIAEIVSSFIGVNRGGDSIYATVSGLDTIYLQNDAQAGDMRFADRKPDGILNEDDYINLGSPFAPYHIGLNIDLAYKGFDLNMHWYGTIGNKIFNNQMGQLSNSDGETNWSRDYYNNHYRDEIRDTEGNVLIEARDGSMPRLDPNSINGNLKYNSSYYIQDGSYFKLKSLQLGYTVPRKYCEMIGLEQLRVYFGANNLLNITKYKGMDTEVDMKDVLKAGMDVGAYPMPRSYFTGITVGF
jgi:TonB-dependent starch-binding outer membrane protein SusC